MKNEKLIHKLYKDSTKDWVKSGKEDFAGMTHGNTNKPDTYGELTSVGVEDIIKKFQSRFDDPEGVFYDLGSGHGRAVSHVALASNMKKVCGVELCKKRHAAAIEKVKEIDFPDTKPTLINGDFFEQDYSDATMVYIDNTMYNGETLDQILPKLPEDCILVYQTGWVLSGDPVFNVQTTYNKNLKLEPGKEMIYYTMTRAAWRYAGGHEF